MRDRLKSRQIERLQEPGRYADGGNLWLQVRSASNKSWLLRYTINGRAREMGLGPFPDVGLAEAREKARIERLRLSEGRDPLEERNRLLAEQRRAQASTILFRDAAKAVIADREGGWSREHRRQWLQSMAQVDPIIGSIPVAAIDTGLVLKCVEPEWKRAQVTADRLRGRIETVLSWAQARGARSGDNPARWKGHLEFLLRDTAKVEHHAALPYEELPAFMEKLRQRDTMGARALEFLILTGLRLNEALGCRWDEISDDVLTIPAERMKARKAHTVPLAPAVKKLLDALPRGSDYVFAATDGRRAGKPIERHAPADTLKALGVEGATVHGFRSTFSDWAHETTAFPNHVIEMALAHAIKKRSEKAYRRGDLLEKRRRLMAAWGEYCGKPVSTPASATVTSIGAQRA
jgi:integrase